jgi:thymidylate synthase (FAD)
MIEVTYIDHMGSDKSVTDAARVSFKKESNLYTKEQNDKLIHYLAKHKHFLPFRHPQVSLHIKAPIFVMRQIDKHQVGFSTSEVSRRYVDEPPEMFTPDKWRKRAENVKQGSGEGDVGTVPYGPFVRRSVEEATLSLYEHAMHLYEALLEAEVAPEQARMILPQAMVTEQYKTGSLLGWYHLVSLRKDPHAQKETQILAEQVENIIQDLFPVSWGALVNG